MGLNVRNVATTNQFRLHANRMHELENFCMQYKHWHTELTHLDQDGYQPVPNYIQDKVQSFGYTDPVFDKVATREAYIKKIKMVEDTAQMTDEVLAPYLIISVTERRSYGEIMAKEFIPCSQNEFYKKRRMFMWILDKIHE